MREREVYGNIICCDRGIYFAQSLSSDKINQLTLYGHGFEYNLSKRGQLLKGRSEALTPILIPDIFKTEIEKQ